MDDSFEEPSSLISKPSDHVEDEEDGQSSDEEDGGLDWTKLQTTARPVIPKRGEKDFEPKPGGGSGLQVHILDRAREAMFDALRATRTTSSKAISYAIWYPDIARAHVTVAKGIHFTAMGHSASRPVIGKEGEEKVQKRLELLPEETIYLVERGSLFCWKKSDIGLSTTSGPESLPGPPMSVQQAYSEMIGLEGLTLEKFQVFAYLKRLGYSVTRADPPNSFYPSPPPYDLSKPRPKSSILGRIFSLFPLWMSRIYRFMTGGFNWWRPVRIGRWLHHNQNYASVFKSMQFIPAGHGVPLEHPNPEKREIARKTSPYHIFFNLYKPSTPFKRSSPPQPDFQIVVINARTTPMPTLQELTDLFDVLPELPLPLPRQRRPIPPQGPVQPQETPVTTILTSPGTIPAPSALPPAETRLPVTPPTTTQQSLIRRLFPWAFPSPPPLSTTPVRRINPFMALKAGKKIIVIAVVDAGNISFFRFGQGAFTEWPMV